MGYGVQPSQTHAHTDNRDRNFMNVNFHTFHLDHHAPMDGPMDGQMDGWTLWTDKASFRVAWPQLKEELSTKPCIQCSTFDYRRFFLIQFQTKRNVIAKLKR